jgi:hypothetical protein
LFVGLWNPNAGPPVVGSALAETFTGGKWQPSTTTLSSSMSMATGGGLATLANGNVVAVLASNPGNAFESALYNGQYWGVFAPVSDGGVGLLSAPAAGATGAVAVQQGPGATSSLALDVMASAWTAGEATTSKGDGKTVPTVALTAAGDPLIVTGTAAGTYTWSLRTGSTWSAPTAIAGVVPPTSGAVGPGPGVRAVARVGVDQIVAVFVAGAAAGSNYQAATFSAGAWSSLTPLSTHVDYNSLYAQFALAALPDGRVAFAHEDGSQNVDVSFWNGTAWSAEKAIPSGYNAQTGYQGVAIAPGVGGAALEVVFIDRDQAVQHWRLLDEAKWTWSTLGYVDGDISHGYSFVSIAAAP